MGHRGNSSWREGTLSKPSSRCISQRFSRSERDAIGWWCGIYMPTYSSSGKRRFSGHEVVANRKQRPDVHKETSMTRMLRGRHATARTKKWLHLTRLSAFWPYSIIIHVMGPRIFQRVCLRKRRFSSLINLFYNLFS